MSSPFFKLQLQQLSNSTSTKTATDRPADVWSVEMKEGAASGEQVGGKEERGEKLA
jgi:hypothetical protein